VVAPSPRLRGEGQGEGHASANVEQAGPFIQNTKKSGRIAAAGSNQSSPNTIFQKKPRRCHQPAFFGLPSLSVASAVRVDFTTGSEETLD
jgi:hypothetical protein